MGAGKMSLEVISKGWFQKVFSEVLINNPPTREKERREKMKITAQLLQARHCTWEFSHVISFYPRKKNSRTENFTPSFLNEKSRKTKLLCPGHTAILFILLQNPCSV